MSTSRYVKRPRVGERLDTPFGVAIVTRVYRHGQRLDIIDAISRIWAIERAPHGTWLRATEKEN